MAGLELAEVELPDLIRPGRRHHERRPPCFGVLPPFGLVIDRQHAAAAPERPQHRRIGCVVAVDAHQHHDLAAAHAGQIRKGTNVPYVAHLLGVASLVLEGGGSEDEAIAALLHDAAEDQGGRERLADIRARYGEQVADIVAHCTDTFDTPKPPWRARKKAYLENLRSAPPAVLRVSLADKLYNARAVHRDHTAHGDRLWERFTADRDEQLWYYGELARLFSDRAPGPMADELAGVVARLRSDALRLGT